MADPSPQPDPSADRAAAAPLFEPFRLTGPASLDLRNRVVMAPMTRRLAPDDRAPDDRIAAYYERRAREGVGLIITEGSHIDDEHAPDSENVPGMFTHAHVVGWRRVTERVVDAGGAIALQLWHTGRHAMRPIGPSPIPAPKRDGGLKPTPREMSSGDMVAVRDAFAHAAELARLAGFDAVEVHGAHGYILDSFVSARSNQRTDAYGGSFANRTRYPLEVLRAVRRSVGPDFPIIYRFSQWKVDDPSAVNYPDPDTLSTWVTALRDAGANVLHVSTRDATEPAFDGSTNTLAGWTRHLSGLPVIAVGSVTLSTAMTTAEPARVTDPAPAAKLVADDEADLVAVGRALIANPDWCAKVRAGRWRELTPYDPAMLKELA